MSEHPLKRNIAEDTYLRISLHRVMLANRRVTIKYLTGTSNGCIQRILMNELHMRKVSVRWEPKILTDGQKEKQVVIWKESLKKFQTNQENRNGLHHQRCRNT